MSTRDERAGIAAETVAIMKKGGYTNNRGDYVELKDMIDNAVFNTQLYTPGMLESLIEKYSSTTPAPDREAVQAVIEVTGETTTAAGHRLYQETEGKDVLCLNFASARNPGGGFLKGSQAQEESLSRATALYQCLLTKPEMYEANSRFKSALYTDHLIYSPRVPVWRDDRDKLLDSPWPLSIISAPAVNAGRVKENEPHNKKAVGKVMERRIKMILAVAAERGYDYLVLGAFGCGVFKNSPADVSAHFARNLLREGPYARCFKTIVFAIPAGGRGDDNHKVFKRALRS